MGTTLPPLVGRARERDAIAGAVDALRSGTGGILELRGEPGIGKSRLLAELASLAAATGSTVLEARASEYEADLPYALWTEALDRHLAEAGARRLSRLGLADPGSLAVLLPALAGLAAEQPAPSDRHRTHRALRDLLERLTATRPLVVCLDDVQWADPASGDMLAALVHRGPRAPVLLAIAGRAGGLPEDVATALARARHEQRSTLLDPGPLNAKEAGELVGSVAPAIYASAGGNPFYLEQLARGHARVDAGAGTASDGSIPPAVAAALTAELAALAPEARGMLDAAAVIGDPFESGIATDVAELPEADALRALDVLLAHALIRPAGAPRRFAFRHPVVRHAVYEESPRGWRLGAHGRAARALGRRGAGPVERAHHIAQSADPGDEEAIALLSTAAGQLQIARTGDRSALLRRCAATAARRARAARAACPHPGQPRGRASRRRGRRERPRDAARRACHRRRRRAARAHGRAGERGVVARARRRGAEQAPGRTRGPAGRAVAGPDPPASRAGPHRAHDL